MIAEAPATIHQCQCALCQDGSDYALIEYHQIINLVLSRLTEPQRRWYVATLAQGPHGLPLRQLVRITGIDRNTIRRGCRELAAGLAALPSDRQRRAGAGQKPAEKKTRS